SQTQFSAELIEETKCYKHVILQTVNHQVMRYPAFIIKQSNLKLAGRNFKEFSLLPKETIIAENFQMHRNSDCDTGTLAYSWVKHSQPQSTSRFHMG
ncbi:unnamed protein product, partial [Allacma fusca]